MIRALTLAIAVLASAPLAAQDHSGHAMGAPPQNTPEVPPEAPPEEGAESKPEMDHCAMGHLPPGQCPPKDEHSGHGNHGAAQSAPMDHSSHTRNPSQSAAGAAPESAIPPRALEGPRHAADAIWGSDAMAPSREQLGRENGGMKTGMLMVERLEARIPADGGETGYLWDAQAWYGGDLNRFVMKAEGEGEFGGGLEDAEIQALYSRAIGPFFDLQAGIRFDLEPGKRSHLVVGVQGLAPYMFHVDGALFFSDKGDLTARVEGEYDQKITQQLILQPRIESEFSAQDIPERELGAGLTKVEAGLRLRYEISPEFAPYIGVEYEAKIGETADIARATGEDAAGLKLLAGLRAWF